MGLEADDAIVLSNSNKLTVRFLPCDVVARIAPPHEHVAQFEIDLARELLAAGSPVAALATGIAPRVFERDDFVMTFWTYYEPLPASVSPAEYAAALKRLHLGMRQAKTKASHFTERIDEAQQLVDSRGLTPDLSDADRHLLADTLRSLRRQVTDGGRDQLLHGEPWPGNLLNTAGGPRFIDLETCCRGPVEFDIAHAPVEVAERYADTDRDLVRKCRLLVLAMVTTWRWDRADQFPNGRQVGLERLSQLRAKIARGGLL